MCPAHDMNHLRKNQAKRRLILSVLVLIMLTVMPCITAYADFTVTLRAEPPEGGTVSGGGTFSPGSNVDILATPNEGYTFVGWYRYGDTEPFSTSPDYTYEQESNRTYIARFEKAITISAVAQPSEGGTVSQNGNGHYIFDESVTLSAEPTEGYAFLGWFDSSSTAEPISTDLDYTFNVSESASFIAKFSPQYDLHVNIEPPDTGTVTGNGTFAGGSIVTLEAIPNDDYRFEAWVSPDDPNTVLSSDATYTFNLDGDTALTAKFARSYGYIWTRIAIFGGIGAAAAAVGWYLYRRRHGGTRADPITGGSIGAKRGPKRRFRWTPPWKKWSSK